MDFFENASNSDLHSDFLAYLHRFRMFLCESLNSESASIFSIMMNHGETNYSIDDFISGADQKMNRAMMYLLIRDYDIELGLHGKNSTAGAIYDHFEDRDDTFHRYDEVESFIREHGIAGLCNSFPVHSESLRKELGEYMYEDVRHDEYVGEDSYYKGESVVDFLRLKARLLCLSPERPYFCESFQEFKSTPIIDKLTDVDFFDADKEIIEATIDEFHISLSDDPFNYSEDAVGNIMGRLCFTWTIEVIRSKIISGGNPVDLIPKLKNIIEIMIKKSDIESEQIDKVTEDLLMLSLAPFPSDYKKVFGNNVMNLEDITQRKNNYSVSSSLPGIGFSRISGDMGLSSNSPSILAEYKSYPMESIASAVGKSEIDCNSIGDIINKYKDNGEDPSLGALILDEWILNMSKKGVATGINSGHAMSLMRKTLETMSQVRDYVDTLSDKKTKDLFNDSLLDIISNEYSPKKHGVTFIFNSNDHRVEFIRKHSLHKKEINEEILQAGGFEQPDFKEFWDTMSTGSKKTIIAQELGL